jgi:ATP-dependent Clp protease, protease subunit
MSKYSKKYVMVETEEDEEVEKNDDENKEIKVINNDIYFYTDITKQSILDLTMIIRKLTSSLLKIKYEFNMDPIIKLHINSEGGEVFAVSSIIHLIETNIIDIHTIIEGQACSAATLLSIVGKKRFITKNSYMLLHHISSECWGKLNELEDEIKNLNLITKNFKELYKQYSNIRSKTFDTLFKKDLLLDARTCLNYGLVDEII